MALVGPYTRARSDRMLKAWGYSRPATVTLASFGDDMMECPTLYKRRYGLRETAEQAVIDTLADPGYQRKRGRLSAYECPSGTHFHIGHR